LGVGEQASLILSFSCPLHGRRIALRANPPFGSN
jgi:hypothetical protein